MLYFYTGSKQKHAFPFPPNKYSMSSRLETCAALLWQKYKINKIKGASFCMFIRESTGCRWIIKLSCVAAA
jgi:hypothetical protein